MIRNRWIFSALRVAIVVAAVGFVVSQVNLADREVVAADGSIRIEPGITSLFLHARPGWIALAFLSFTAFTMTGIIRWWLLLRAQSLPVSFPAAVRLSFIGQFFNTVMPGPTGGDVIKAICVARHVPDRRARAVTTVFVDRVVGLIAIVALGGIVAAFHAGDETFRQAACVLLGLLAVGAVGAVPFAFKSVRRALRLDRLLAALPFQRVLREIDSAILIYRDRPAALGGIFLFSVVTQIFGVTDAWCMSRALGMDVSLAHLVVVIAVIAVFSSIPISPGGWGIGEGLYAYFFRFIGVAASPAVAISVSTRLIATVHSLVGGLFLLRAPADVRAARREASAAP